MIVCLFTEDAVHITAILGEGVIFNCHVEFPNDHPVPYVLQWDKKVSETVRYRKQNLFIFLLWTSKEGSFQGVRPTK